MSCAPNELCGDCPDRGACQGATECLHGDRPMPDDRPVSPREALLEELCRRYALVRYPGPPKVTGEALTWDQLGGEARAHLRFDVERAIERVEEMGGTVALSTPAGPSPEPTYECSQCRAPKGVQALGESCNNNCGGRVVEAAPSPREEAVEAVDRDALIEMVTSAISQSAADRPKKEGTRQRFRRYAMAAVDSLSAARPSSPTPEETPERELPERCPRRRQGDGKQCVRPVGHPADCAASYGSTTADFGHDPGDDTTTGATHV